MSGLIFFVLIIVFFLLPLFSYLIFWYEAANSSYGMTLDHDSDGNIFLWLLRGIFSSILSNVVVLCLFPLGFMKKLWAPIPDTKKGTPTVVLIHGIYHNASAWAYYRWRLKQKGYTRIYVFSFSSWKTTFEGVYEKFEAWINRIEKECSGQDMVLVGHSLGGLLAKTYASRRDGDHASVIRRVITLGTPFMGSKMVVLGFGALARSLHYKGALLRELGKDRPF